MNVQTVAGLIGRIRYKPNALSTFLKLVYIQELLYGFVNIKPCFNYCLIFIFLRQKKLTH